MSACWLQANSSRYRCHFRDQIEKLQRIDGCTRVWSLMGTKSHSINCSLDSNRNKMTLPNEKTSDFLSFFSKHSGLAKTGVPPLESDPAIPKSVKTISICVKSVGQFRNFTKKFWGLISLWVWFLLSSVSRLPIWFFKLKSSF